MKIGQRDGWHRVWTALQSVLALVLIVATGDSRLQAAVIDLGTADSFAVLANATITNTGPTVVSGDIGVHPGSAITGFFGTVENDGPGNFTGTSHQADGVASLAMNDPGGPDANDAYVTLANMGPAAALAAELGGQTLNAGVYNLSSEAQLTGTLTLDGPGQYVFQIGSALTTASNSTVALINGADACDIWFVADTAATLGTGTDFNGNIITLKEAITLNTGATINGRLISLGAAVTLDTNLVSVPFCPEPGSSAITVTDDEDRPVISGGPSTTLNGTDFGTVLLDSTAQQIFTITNPGDTDLEIFDLVIGGDFSLVGLFPDSIAPGASADFLVDMDTSILGPTTGTVTINTNSPQGVFTFDLEGNVVLQIAAGIPEPATASLALMGIAGMMLRRRRLA